MPEIANKVTIDIQTRRLFIDDVEFPWHLSGDEPGLTIDELDPIRNIAVVRVPILARGIEVIPADGDIKRTSADGDVSVERTSLDQRAYFVARQRLATDKARRP